MATKIPVNQSANAVFDADGEAVAEIGPSVYGTAWNIKRIVVNTNSTRRTRLKVYHNFRVETALVDATFLGNQDTSETDITLGHGERLLFVWQNGDPGAIATVVITGEQVR